LHRIYSRGTTYRKGNRGNQGKRQDRYQQVLHDLPCQQRKDRQSPRIHQLLFPMVELLTTHCLELPPLERKTKAGQEQKSLMVVHRMQNYLTGSEANRLPFLLHFFASKFVRGSHIPRRRSCPFSDYLLVNQKRSSKVQLEQISQKSVWIPLPVLNFLFQDRSAEIIRNPTKECIQSSTRS